MGPLTLIINDGKKIFILVSHIPPMLRQATKKYENKIESIDKLKYPTLAISPLFKYRIPLITKITTVDIMPINIFRYA